MKWLLFVLSFPILAQNKPFVYRPDGMDRIQTTADITYRELKSGKLSFDLFRPSDPQIHPVLIFLNTIGAPMRTWEIYRGWGKAAAVEGLAAINFDSRPGSAVEDFDSLMSYLRKNASTLRIDPERIALYAASANMSLGMYLMMDPERQYVRAGLAYYGSSAVQTFRLDVPVFLIRAGLDNITTNYGVDQFVQRAMAANAPFTVTNFTGGHHGFEVEDDNDYSRHLIRTSLAFVKNHLENAGLYNSGMGEFSTPVDQLIAEAEKGIAAEPKNGQAWQKLARYQLMAKKYAECLQSYDRAIKAGSMNFGDMGLKALEAAALLGDIPSAIVWTSRLQEVGWIEQWDILKIRNFEALKNYPAFVTAYTEIQTRPNRFGLLNLIAEKGIPRGKEVYESALKTSSGQPPFSETGLNWIGYQLIGRQKNQEALEVFMWNVKAYPASSAAYDAVADACEALGDTINTKLWTSKALESLKTSSATEEFKDQIRKLSDDRLKRLKK